MCVPDAGSTVPMTATVIVHSDPEILGGTPVFVGTRVPLRNLIDYHERGYSSTNSSTRFRLCRASKPSQYSKPPIPS
jgi:uncharacterized protein (DUF433 family)